MAVDGSYCSRNGMTYLCNVILSAERSAPDARDRVTVPFDMVTLTRRTQKDAPLKEVCSLLRDGSTCFAHGSEAGWRQKVTHTITVEVQVHFSEAFSLEKVSIIWYHIVYTWYPVKQSAKCLYEK